jgi:hypothetical protein
MRRGPLRLIASPSIAAAVAGRLPVAAACSGAPHAAAAAAVAAARLGALGSGGMGVKRKAASAAAAQASDAADAAAPLADVNVDVTRDNFKQVGL